MLDTRRTGISLVHRFSVCGLVTICVGLFTLMLLLVVVFCFCFCCSNMFSFHDWRECVGACTRHSDTLSGDGSVGKASV